jgi:hypothetical protein
MREAGGIARGKCRQKNDFPHAALAENARYGNAGKTASEHRHAACHRQDEALKTQRNPRL